MVRVRVNTPASGTLVNKASPAPPANPVMVNVFALAWAHFKAQYITRTSV